MSGSNEELDRIREYKKNLSRSLQHLDDQRRKAASARKEKIVREEVLNRNKGELRKAITILLSIGIFLCLVFSCLLGGYEDETYNSNDYRERVKEAAEKEFWSRDAAYCLQYPSRC